MLQIRTALRLADALAAGDFVLATQLLDFYKFLAGRP